MERLVEVKGLRKRYAAFALEDVSFTLTEGCITGFIGANGAGKTTTIRTLLGLARRDAGEVRFFGLELDGHEREIKDRLGIVMDGSYFYGGLSMDEMKRIIAPAYTRWSDEDYRRYMERFDLDPRQKIDTLSSGMKMKYALVLALSHQAELLIMDEPTSGLDPLVRSQFLEIIMNYMREGGRGVFFSTHITSDLDKTADMLILIDGGRLCFQKSRDELLESYRIVKGDTAMLDEESRAMLRNLKVTPFGFSAVTDCAAALQRKLPDAVFERASVEEIMLACIGGDRS